ncbi:YqjF family protein [Micromonospora sp. NPDC006431]|uniref:YqjF family protein n=1 Tax=Micromonospora sp. NPDC006431 TaxID=3364235 RepID=UPI00369A1DFB
MRVRPATPFGDQARGGRRMGAPPSPKVPRPLMCHRWSWITFIHWRCPPSMLQPMLPPGLAVDTFDGSAWVGLTPFLMQGVRIPALPAVPWLSSFPETNVRTYARDRQGRRGIWFLSLDAARLPAVLAARVGYRLPYYWSDMAVRVSGTRVAYRCARRQPGPRRLRCDADVRLGPPLREVERDELAHFLTARYRLFTVIAGGLAAAEVEHPEWPLRRVELLRLDQNLLTGAGLPAPAGEPILHASRGVPVRVGRWHR